MEENRSIGGLPNSPIERLKPGKNHLFAIGINKYENEKIPKLTNACRDIIDLAKLLKEEYSFDDQVLLLDEAATRSNIINKLNELPRKIEPEDKLLIYYSGHGKVDENDDTRGYWIPVDGEINDISSYVTNADVTDIIKSIDARHILLISDSCFSASLLQKFRSIDDEGEGAYDNMEKNKSRWAFVSGKGVVSDGAEGEHSPFAKGIIKQLNKNQDKINISLLADQVIKQVSNLYDQEAVAIPLRTKEHEEGGQFVFVKKQTEKEDWAHALSFNTEGSYGAYLDKYPGGKYIIEANQKLIDIADEKEWNKTIRLDAAFAYRQYLQKYPKGIHVSEAENNLNKFKTEPQPSNKITPPKKPDSNKIGNEIEQPKGKSKMILYVAIIALIGLAGFGMIKYSSSQNPISNDINALDRMDTVVTDPSFVMEGEVLDTGNHKLVGIILTNNRNKISVLSNENAQFKIANTLIGDTITSSENDQYLSSFFIVVDNKSSGKIALMEKPIIKENKTITGVVSGSIINHVYIYVKRNNSIVKVNGKYGTHSKSNGTYTLTGVNDGDILWFETGKGKFSKKVTREIIYNFNGASIEAVTSASPSKK